MPLDEAPSLTPVGDVSLANLPREVILLAERIKAIHGDVRIAEETNGYHLYCASPICLEKYGTVELQKRHLAINVEKATGTGKFLNVSGYNADRVAKCMKTGEVYGLGQLLSMPPLEERGIKVTTSSQIFVQTTSKCLVDDGRGNMIPDGPGETIPIDQLPDDHPAVQYIRNRNYDIATLRYQYSIEYCVREAPESRDKQRFYKRLPGGFRDTPQGRIIFYAFVNGVRKGWQARIIDKVIGNLKLYWHPYENRWAPMEQKVDGKWVALPGLEGFDPAKYKTAFGAQRNKLVIGFDAAVAWNKTYRPDNPLGFLSEGPLDAGRVGPPGMAVLGKHCSPEQAHLVASAFRKVIVLGQNDKAGEGARQKMFDSLSPFVSDVVILTPPEGIKDFGEMSPTAAAEIILPHV